jgi:NAD(P)-dependent dehydrogenase (short-subunit alcohol dehydrogenase family)
MTQLHAGTSTAYGRPYRPAPVALANRVGELAGLLGLEGADLGEASLMEAASRKTGLDDFGDASFRERLRLLLDSVEKEARLHPLGRFMARQNFIRILSNRLRIREELGTRPDALPLEMEDPVFIIGLQRTGTTMLHRLLATDPRFRYLRSWEAVNPAPPPGWDGRGEDPRIRGAALAQGAVRYLAPDFFSIHPIEARGPEEDVLLFDYDLWSTVPEATQRVPTFSAWLEKQDHRPAYLAYRDILRLLQGQGPGGRWLLKTPHHMEHLDVLLDVFPGARIIQTHRDPARVLASFCSMVAHAYGIFSDRVDPVEIGRHWSRKAERMVRLAMDVRRGDAGNRFIDVAYADLVADPIGQVRRVYDFLGLDLTLDAGERMRAWVRDNPQHKHGRHNYSLEHFGLNEKNVAASFAAYRERFAIAGEGGKKARAAGTGTARPLEGKVVLVTGATSGHGRAAARALARLGGEVILLGRSLERCLDVQHQIAWETEGRGPRILVCDLASGRDIERAAGEFLSWNLPLHVLVNNAGIVSRTRRESPDGVELTFAVNYLAQFNLTMRLLERLRRSAPARIINVSSDTHRVYTLDLDDLESRRGYSFMGAYGRSKHAIVYFTLELARRLEGSGVTVNALDPGPVASNIAGNNPGLLPAVSSLLINLLFPSADKAARTAVWLASAPELDGDTGGYFKACAKRTPRIHGGDPSVGNRLWEVSASMTGVDFPDGGS